MNRRRQSGERGFMFSQLLFVRLRTAEKALRDGHIDEAYRLASAADLRSHPRGAAVLGALAEQFLARARENYRADKFTEALMDLDRAEAGGVLKDEINELRGYVRMVALERNRRDDSRRERIQEAQKRIERGSLAAGRDLLEQATSDPEAQAVLKRAAWRAQEAERVVQQAESLLRAGRIAEAAGRIKKAKALDAHFEPLGRLEAELVQTVLGNVAAAVEQGNLSRAASELACLGDLGARLPARREADEVLKNAKQGGDALRRNDYAEARRQVMVLARRLSHAPWVQAALTQLEELERLHAAVATGPLGDHIEPGPLARPAVADRARANGPKRLDETRALTPGTRVPGQAADRYLLLVDGGGSYLLIRGDQASIGRASTDIPADVPIMSDLAERHANINRVEDDYFIFSAKELEIGGERRQHALLRDGDRVVLGKKAKFTFRLPSRKSSTAILELSDTTKAPNDVRRIVLLHQHAILSNSPSAHVFCRHAGSPLILFERNGSLWIRAKSDGHVDTEAKPLIPGEPFELAGASLTLAPWKPNSPGRSA
jgi:hypothetical protein